MQKEMLKSCEVVFLNDESNVLGGELVLLGDKSTISSNRILRDSGEMIAPVTIARTGIMRYRAHELGDLFKDRDPNAIIRVMTTPEVLFDQATIDGCRSIPLTIGHPKVAVDIKNNKELQKGFLEGIPVPDGTALAGHVVITDEAAIKLVDSGVDQISLGHKSRLVRVDDNDDYDCLKTTIVPNHAAIVRNGRAQTTRIGDSGEEVAIVDKVLLDEAIAERDVLSAKVDALTVQLEKAKDTHLSDEDVAKKIAKGVKERTGLLVDLARLGDEYSQLATDAMTTIEIKRAAVSKLLDADMKDRSDTYVETRFEIALEDSGETTLSDALNQSILNDEKVQKENNKPTAREQAASRRAERYNKL